LRQILKGDLKVRKQNQIIKNDIFEAKKVGKGTDLKLIYETYLKWFNHTRTKT